LLKAKLFAQRPLIFVFMAFYLLFVAGILYTSNVEYGKFNLEKKLSLLALPLFLGTSISLSGKIMENTLKLFVLSCLAACLICLGNGLFRYFFNGDRSFLFHEKLSSPVNFHPPYFGMYLSFSVLVIFERVRKNHSNRLRFSLLMMLAFFFFCFIILLSARTSLVFLFIAFLAAGIFYFYKKNKLTVWLTSVFAATVITILLISQSNYLKERFVKPLTSDISVTEGGGETGLSIRLVKWKCSWEGIKEDFIFGTGTGDAEDYLVKCYEKKNFWGMYPQYRYNSHNQYLETALTLGLPGFILLLACMFIPACSAFRKKQYLFLSFLALFAFCSLTESLMERQQGIVFFTFFISLFAFSEKK